MPKKTKELAITPELKELAVIFKDDRDLGLFFVEWLSNGQNATAAYQKLHPEVTHGSAAVLAHRMLKRVNFEDILAVYGIGIQKYLDQLREGLEASYYTLNGQAYPDHKTRRTYHEALGKLLGLERSSGGPDMSDIGEFAVMWRAKDQK